MLLDPLGPHPIEYHSHQVQRALGTEAFTMNEMGRAAVQLSDRAP
jgi:hypothetical protein